MNYKIVIVDTVGLMYDGNTINNRGLGGSEASIVLMSRELVKLGFSVVVYNKCDGTTTRPGTYDGVEYRPFSHVPTETFDILISSRHVTPFIPDESTFKTFNNIPYSFEFASRLREGIKHKILWMHDTFSNGDLFIEELVVNGYIDEIFTLSDFHTSYVTNCDHGKRRNFEVLKNKIFITRNGINLFDEWTDISKKDKNLFVFNAAFMKGMGALSYVWPRIRERIPQAKIKIIGGYYLFNDEGKTDKQYEDWYRLKQQYENQNLGMEFTGLLTQKEISEILKQASFNLYPAAYPETYGISTLESLAYNTPLVTCRFGALEETAIEQACYLIDYAIEPNSLFTHINTNFQVDKFVETVVSAYNNPYLHQQKMYYCNIVKDICTWDKVALQWKQHLYRKLGDYLPINETRRLQTINTKVHEVFGRRFSNKEDFLVNKTKENRIVCIVPFYNCEHYIERCLKSIVSQNYDNYRVYLIDDASTDNSVKVINGISQLLNEKFNIWHNRSNMGAVYNQISAIKRYCGDDDIVILIDGDDALINRPDVFDIINNLHNDGAEFTYGSCWSEADNIPLIAQPYPPEIKNNLSYRQYNFNWGIPYTHLRTFRKSLLNDIPEEEFKDQNGEWYRAGGDNAVFYSIIERADPNRVIAVPEILYLYNDKNPMNDYKVNNDHQSSNRQSIIKQSDMSDSLFTFIIPTMWKVNDILFPFLHKLLTHPLVGEVIIINNNPKQCLGYPNHEKLKVLDYGENIYVNPAWNRAVEVSRYDKLCIMNDDITFDLGVLHRLKDRVTPEVGLHGINPGNPEFYQTPITDGKPRFEEYRRGDYIFGFCTAYFVHKQNYKPVPEEMKIYYGDTLLFEWQIYNGRKNYFISNLFHQLNCASTVTTLNNIEEIYGNDSEVWKKINEWIIVGDPTPIQGGNKKKILIAVPTNNSIGPETFKSIFNLKIPYGYEVEYQHFHGYRIDQVRNLIAHWVIEKKYDYLFAVDYDITFPPDTLERMINHDKDLVSGVYIQRNIGNIVELYGNNGRLEEKHVAGDRLIPITACGFGCVLVKREVLESVGHPQFEYHVALNHLDTFSEDHDFCKKAREKGFNLWADTSIKCGHIGSYEYRVS